MLRPLYTFLSHTAALYCQSLYQIVPPSPPLLPSQAIPSPTFLQYPPPQQHRTAPSTQHTYPLRPQDNSTHLSPALSPHKSLQHAKDPHTSTTIPLLPLPPSAGRTPRGARPAGRRARCRPASGSELLWGLVGRSFTVRNGRLDGYTASSQCLLDGLAADIAAWYSLLQIFLD
jgi:hypothetical protein